MTDPHHNHADDDGHLDPLHQAKHAFLQAQADILRQAIEQPADSPIPDGKTLREFCPEAFEDEAPDEPFDFWGRQAEAFKALPALFDRARAAGLPAVRWEVNEFGHIDLHVTIETLDEESEEVGEDAAYAQAFDAWAGFLSAEVRSTVCQGERLLLASSAISPAGERTLPVYVHVRASTPVEEPAG